jgi:hypothetical protein
MAAIVAKNRKEKQIKFFKYSLVATLALYNI